MKKLILLLGVFALTLSSCSNDDDTPPVQMQDQVIGTWKLFQVYENDQLLPISLIPCATEQSLVFLANEEFSFERYIGFDTCILDEAIFGTWSKTDGKYNLINDGETEVVEYSLDQNRLSLEDTYVEDGVTNNVKFVYAKQ